MLTNTWVGQYYVGTDGKWIEGMKQQGSADSIYGHYSTEGYYGHTANHHIMMDVYNGGSSSAYDTIIEFGLFDHLGNTGDYYSKSSPNRDRIKGRIAYGNGYYYGGGVG